MRSFFLYLCLIALQMIVSVQSANSIYAEYNLSNKLCHPFEITYRIDQHLNDEKPAILVHSQKKYIFGTTGPNDHCKFAIETQNRKNGIFAVIQDISLRGKISEKCIDYVQLQGETVKGKEFCGQFNRRVNAMALREANLDDPNQSINYGEFSPNGLLNTRVKIADIKMSTDYVLNLTIAYTMYKDCNKTDPNRYQRVVQDNNICILKEFFCDGIYNCGGMAGCLDEEGCTESLVTINNDIGTKVAIAVVTAILQCLVFFTVFLWICRRQKKLCWSPDCAGPSAEQNTPALSLDIDNRHPNNSIPTAPMLEMVLPSSVQDKDLPPSYDSLFPENPNHENQ